MRLIIAIALAGLLAVAGPSSAQMTLTGAGGTKVVASAGNQTALDGSNTSTGNTVTSGTITITTSNTNDLVVLCSENNGAGTPSITDTSGLTWTQIGTHTGTIDAFFAFSSGPLSSDTITVNYGTTVGFFSLIAFGVSGVPVSSQLDPNGALPGTTTSSTPLTLTTSNANDFLFACYSSNNGTGNNQGSGWTLIGSGANFMMGEFQIVTSTQSALSAAVGGGTAIKNGIGSAIKSR